MTGVSLTFSNAMNFASETGSVILEAGATGDLAKLKEIKKKVDDVDFRRICDVINDLCTGRRVLHHAAEMGHFQVCKFLIENAGVYIDVLTDKEDSPLMLAAKAEKVNIVKYLISKGAEVQMSSDKGFTALHYAVQKGNLELMELLLKSGADIDAESVDGTPLQYAASCGSVEAVKFLLKNNAEPDAITSFFGSPLISAIKSRSFECMELLLKGKADPNQYLYGLNTLSHAAKEGDTRYLNRLIEAGADPSLVNSSNHCFLQPVEHAALAHNPGGVEILFPKTKRIPRYPNWSVDGILAYCHSEETNTEYTKGYLEVVDDLGKSAVKSKDYLAAIAFYTEAAVVDPLNIKWLANRSLCFARIGRGVPALRDAEECVRHSPKWPKAHYREGSAWLLFENYYMAARAFGEASKLDPNDKEILKALKDAQCKYISKVVVYCPMETIDFINQYL
ncbi:uncharacterized protein LOC131023870 isoform X2 [Salvia miltiorrhiza]|uniref:uncharacterized protein LOC131023870 isoform X2 n=1 Tax=Salvia miltiorrhiza TaxID=226208 RepID=UPI0025AC2DDD|nr:uncharacterized protein LOC131023870 isoform X2 [Salvia miltiorrhiza]